MSEQARVAAARDQAVQMFPDLRSEFEGGLSHCWRLDPGSAERSRYTRPTSALLKSLADARRRPLLNAVG